MSGDLIRRQDVIDAMYQLEAEDIETYGCSIPEGFDAKPAVEALKALPSAEPERKWISVTEALPKDGEFVLLTIRRLDKKYNQNSFISVGYISWNQNAWWCAHDGDCDAHNVNVLAWMPLPEPWRSK